MMRTKIYDFNTSIYISAIQRLVFHLPHVLILGTNHCGELQHTAFKGRALFNDVLCRCDTDERVVSIFVHPLQSVYYGGNISVYIYSVELERFSALSKADINSTTPSRQCHLVFHYFYLSIENKMLPLLIHTSIV